MTLNGDDGSGEDGDNEAPAPLRRSVQGDSIEVRSTVPEHQTDGYSLSEKSATGESKIEGPEQRSVEHGGSQGGGQAHEYRPQEFLRVQKHPDPEDKENESPKPISRAERRRLIKEEIRRLSQGEAPVYYQRRLW